MHGNMMMGGGQKNPLYVGSFIGVTGAGAVTPSWPVGTQAGDFVIIHAGNSGIFNPTPPTVTGWTITAHTWVFGYTFYTARKVLTSGDISSPPSFSCANIFSGDVFRGPVSATLKNFFDGSAPSGANTTDTTDTVAGFVVNPATSGAYSICVDASDTFTNLISHSAPTRRQDAGDGNFSACSANITQYDGRNVTWGTTPTATYRYLTLWEFL